MAGRGCTEDYGKADTAGSVKGNGDGSFEFNWNVKMVL